MVLALNHRKLVVLEPGAGLGSRAERGWVRAASGLRSLKLAVGVRVGWVREGGGGCRGDD